MSAMTTVTFDTLELTRILKEAGLPPEQAEAVVRTIVRSQEGIVTRDFLDIRLAELKTDLIKWMTVALIAQAAVIAALVKLL